MTSLSIRLEARSAAHRCYRADAIDVATDPFGAWLGWPGAVVLVCHRGSFRAVTGPQRPAVLQGSQPARLRG